MPLANLVSQTCSTISKGRATLMACHLDSRLDPNSPSIRTNNTLDRTSLPSRVKSHACTASIALKNTVRALHQGRPIHEPSEMHGRHRHKAPLAEAVTPIVAGHPLTRSELDDPDKARQKNERQEKRASQSIETLVKIQWRLRWARGSKGQHSRNLTRPQDIQNRTYQRRWHILKPRRATTATEEVH